MGFFRKSKPEPAALPQRFIDAGRQAAEKPHYLKQQSHDSSPYGIDETQNHGSAQSNGSAYEQAGSYRRQEQPHHYQASHGNNLAALQIKGAYDRDDFDDFDDAASYHSISSNPGMSRPKTGNGPMSAPASANPGSYGYHHHTMPSRYMQMAAQGRGAARANNPDIDSYYSMTGDNGDDNIFRNANQNFSPVHGQRAHPQAWDKAHMQTQSPIQTQTQTQAQAQAHAQAHAYSNIQSPQSPFGHGLQSPNSNHMRSPAMQQAQPNAKPKTEEEIGEEYFQKAVNFHEMGDLVSATAYFKRAADKHNPLGMLFYGLSLRHGWGCQPNENLAFVFLQKAGENVVPHVKDLDPAVAGMAREELAMAIYELGQSYRQGWGVSRNKKTAAYYFEVAANLGDADAQGDLAACYEKGDGVKRDMKKAAHYYRLAHKQGVELFGTSWIYKKKYDSD